MKVGILTWYKAINHGAVLQAYASCKILESMNVKPVILDFRWNLYTKKDKKGTLKRYVKKLSIKQILWHLKVRKFRDEKKIIFEDFVNNYLPVGMDYEKEKNLGAVYIGSDMVFDITEGYNPYMYGIGVNSKYIFSYAASFGYSTIETIQLSGHEAEIVEGLKQFKSIGYRDINTLQILNHYNINSHTHECIDPVLCYGFQKEIAEWDSGKWKDESYIVIYAYESTMNESSTIEEIRKMARNENLRIISCGYYHKWCDECVNASPKEFIEIFKYAKYVITDTFHGTVFSLILHKSFVAIVRRNGFKLRYLLKSANLLDRIAADDKDIKNIMKETPNFKYFDEWISNSKYNSRTFISDNINDAKKYIN